MSPDPEREIGNPSVAFSPHLALDVAPDGIGSSPDHAGVFSNAVRDASKPRSVGADGWRARLVSFSAREHSLPLSFWVPGSQAGISKGCSVARCRNLPKTSSVLADFLGQRFPRGGGRPDQSRDVRAFATSHAYANTPFPRSPASVARVLPVEKGRSGTDDGDRTISDCFNRTRLGKTCQKSTAHCLFFHPEATLWTLASEKLIKPRLGQVGNGRSGHQSSTGQQQRRPWNG